MDKTLQRRFSRLEGLRRRLLAEAAMWPPERLRYKPSAETWSMLEILDHLHQVEEALLAAMRSGRGNPLRATAREGVMAWVVAIVMLTPVRVKAPRGAPLANNCGDLDELKSSWERCRSEMAGFLVSLKAEDLRRGLARHPVSGAMTAGQTLRFIEAHLRHHLFQVARLRKAAGVTAG